MTQEQVLHDYVLPYANAFLVAFAPAAFGTLMLWLRARGIKTGIIQAAGGAAGIAYLSLAKSGKPLTDAVALKGALGDGEKHMLNRVPGYLSAEGMKPEDVAAMVASRFGELLAIDPTVTVAAAPIAPSVPAPIPVSAVGDAL